MGLVSFEAWYHRADDQCVHVLRRGYSSVDNSRELTVESSYNENNPAASFTFFAFPLFPTPSNFPSLQLPPATRFCSPSNQPSKCSTRLLPSSLPPSRTIPLLLQPPGTLLRAKSTSSPPAQTPHPPSGSLPSSLYETPSHHSRTYQYTNQSS